MPMRADEEPEQQEGAAGSRRRVAPIDFRIAISRPFSRTSMMPLAMIENAGDQDDEAEHDEHRDLLELERREEVAVELLPVLHVVARRRALSAIASTTGSVRVGVGDATSMPVTSSSMPRNFCAAGIDM